MNFLCVCDCVAKKFVKINEKAGAEFVEIGAVRERLFPGLQVDRHSVTAEK